MSNLSISKAAIMQSAWRNFLKKGYYQAGIREIAADAGVSLGLVNHYFKSKKNLAAHIVTFLWNEARDWGLQYVPQEDVVLLDAVVTRGMNRLMLSELLHDFYITSLQEDVFFDSLTAQTSRTLAPLHASGFRDVPDRDLIYLYTKILPYETEKALILKKEKGMFQNIPYEDIPYYVCLEALRRIVPPEEIRCADQQGREIVAAHFSELLNSPWEQDLAAFTEKLL